MPQTQTLATARQQLLARLSASRELHEGDVVGVARLLTTQAATLFEVERVSVWRYSDAKDELHCLDLYLRSADRHEQGAVLQQQAFAAEFEALRDAQYVDASNPYSDPRTRGYVDGYLRPNRISSMLDAVVRLGEERVGMVCLEHVDRPHQWSDTEIAFASQLGDQLALAISMARHQALVTQLRERDARLQAFNEELERRVVERSSELQAAQAALSAAQALAQLGQVLAGVAHELNTPIGNGRLAASTLVGQARQFAQRLEDGGLTRSALQGFVGQQLQGAEMVERSLQRAIVLIQSLKTVAADQVSGERRRFRLQAVVQDVLEMLSPSLRRHPCALQLDLTLDPALELDSYPGPLGQVLVNLMNNALLHAFDGRAAGKVRIAATALGGQGLRLEFADDGCGIPAERQHRLFDAFYSTKHGQGGCGLGLHLVREIVTQRLGGRIGVRSAPGRGCAFELELPLQAP